MNMLEADENAEEAAENVASSGQDSNESQINAKNQRLIGIDPCLDKHCGAGRVCKVR